jgi:OPA family glycerol-3-phosphate transporter-like MFS transporter/OPA family sugar phosphate sensor protein UhpC-like MFS transporter
MAHWFPPKELSTKMSIWNTSHSIGTIAVLVAAIGALLFAFAWPAKAHGYAAEKPLAA